MTYTPNKERLTVNLSPRVTKSNTYSSPEEDIEFETEEEFLQARNKDILALKEDIKLRKVNKYKLMKRVQNLKQSLSRKVVFIQRKADNLKANQAEEEKKVNELKLTLSEIKQIFG